jgi:hypothetical protein
MSFLIAPLRMLVTWIVEVVLKYALEYFTEKWEQFEFNRKVEAAKKKLKAASTPEEQEKAFDELQALLDSRD